MLWRWVNITVWDLRALSVSPTDLHHLLYCCTVGRVCVREKVRLAAREDIKNLVPIMHNMHVCSSFLPNLVLEIIGRTVVVALLLVLCLDLLTTSDLNANQEIPCPIKERYGFLVRWCGKLNFTCINSPELSYDAGNWRTSTRMYKRYTTLVCPEDLLSYQACSVGIRYDTRPLFPRAPVCGVLCPTSIAGTGLGGTSLNEKNVQYVYKEKQVCTETGQFVELSFPGLTPGRVVVVEREKLCDGRCEATLVPPKVDRNEGYCHDEIRCNGLNYGIIMDLDIIYPFETTVLPFGYVEPEAELEAERCEVSIPGIRPNLFWFPLYNGSRCFPFEDLTGEPFCENGYDQTNCSDASLVVGSCLVGGFMSTISKYITCSPSHDIVVCDNGLDGMCERINPICTIHKTPTVQSGHRLGWSRRDGCNLVIDYRPYVDEGVLSRWRDAHCGPLGDRKCQLLKYPGRWALGIVIRGVNDGVTDCRILERGVLLYDEKGYYDRCLEGVPTTERVGRVNVSCVEVFYCTPKREIFTELSDLCQPQSECGFKMCPVSRKGLTVSSVIPFDAASSSHIMPQCMKGIDSIRNLTNSPCDSKIFLHGFHNFFGKSPETTVTVPSERSDCILLFGEAYLYYSCIGKCLGKVWCPLKIRVDVSSCTNYLSGRLHALATDNSHVTTVFRLRGGYHNNVFVCRNNRCNPFRHVCNLENDCGDGSDEKDCENNWMCEDGSTYLSLDQFCNGKQDCQDFSDECNDTCTRKVLDTTMLVAAAIIGSAGLLLNVGNLTRRNRQKREKNGHFINRNFAFLISLGDLTTSLYLLGLVIVHVSKGTAFCKMQLQWLSSPACGILGSLSTTGAITSSISMAALSFFRLYGTVKASRFVRSGEVTNKVKNRVYTLQAFVVFLAATIATIPVVPWLNDWFVNGLTFENNVRIFLGVMDKNELHDVIRRYHGSRKIGQVTGYLDGSHLSWDQISKITRKMFSEDYNPITEKRISFYGNDAVCLFKYFVKMDDPQVVFVWCVIALHCGCFVTVALFHVLIGVIAKKSQTQSKSKGNDLNIKVTLICITDFCCWMPFLICCILHTAEVLDMSPWYQVFSIIILPLNSVLNPLLYSDLVKRLFAVCRSDMGDATSNQIGDQMEIEMKNLAAVVPNKIVIEVDREATEEGTF
eukprot:sb/3479338/